LPQASTAPAPAQPTQGRLQAGNCPALAGTRRPAATGLKQRLISFGYLDRVRGMSRTSIILAVIVLVGIGVRLSYLASDPHDFRLESQDGELARNLVAGRGFTVNNRALEYAAELRAHKHRATDPAAIDYAPVDRHADWQPEIFQPIGGGALLAGIWEITGSERYLPMQILQAVLDALCALLVFWISLRLFKRRTAALLAAGLYAVYFPIAWQTTVIYVDIWAVDLTLAIVAVYLKAIDSPHPWRWLSACGLLTAASVYFRPTLVLLPAILALATISGVVGWRRTLARALVPTVIALILVIPWTIRNYHDFHSFTFVRTAFGDTMWSGLGEVHNNFGANPDDSVTIVEVHRLRPDLQPYSPKWDNFILKHFVIPTIENHPFFYAKVVGRRVIRSTLLDYEGTWMHGVTLPRGRSLSAFASFSTSHPLGLLEDAFQPLIFLSALLTLVLTWRRWRRQHIFLLAILLSVLIPYIVIHLESRYILPAACTYVIWIGLGIDLLAERAGKSLELRRARLLVDAAT
jgi:4-amino-4-deoxy-L-arabinose transferase-like glycosyltransferase